MGRDRTEAVLLLALIIVTGAQAIAVACLIWQSLRGGGSY